MKTVNILLLALLYLGLSNCSYKNYPTNPSSRLTDIPTHKHYNHVDVYFVDDEINQDFLPIQILRSQKTGEDSYESIVNDLQVQARKLGFDAIIIEEYEDGYETHTTAPSILDIILSITLNFDYEPTYEDVYFQGLKAVGIKYRKNIDYLDKYVYSKTIWKQSEEGRQKVASATYNLFGKIMNLEGDSMGWKKYQSYTLEHLVYEKKAPWTWRDVSNQDQKRWKRKYTLPSSYRKVDVRFMNPTQVNYLDIKKKRTHPQLETISEERMRVVYQKGSKDINRTELYRDEKLIRSEEYFYDQEGRIMQRQVFQFKDKKKILDKTIVYSYYKNSDLDHFFTKSDQNQD
jgi:hypothetical protein